MEKLNTAPAILLIGRLKIVQYNTENNNNLFYYSFRNANNG